MVGDGQGRVRWYRNIGTDAAPQLIAMGPLTAAGLEIHLVGPVAPTVIDWNHDGKKDLLVGAGDGTVSIFLNVGTDTAPAFDAGATIPLPDVGGSRSNARPFVVDWNEDGRMDLLVGDANGRTYLFLNTGTEAAPAFASGAPLTGQAGSIVINSNAAPFLVDWNNDGLLDLLIGSGDGEVFLIQGATFPASTGK